MLAGKGGSVINAVHVPYIKAEVSRLSRLAIRHIFRKLKEEEIVFPISPRFEPIGSDSWLNYRGYIRLQADGHVPFPVSGQVRHGSYGRQGAIVGTVVWEEDGSTRVVEWWYCANRYDFMTRN